MRAVVLKKEAMLKNEAGRGSSWGPSGAGNSSRTFPVFGSVARGVK